MPSDLEEPASDQGDSSSRRTLARRALRRRIVAWVSVIVTLALGVAALIVYLGYRHLNGNIRVRNIGGLVGAQPVDLHPGAQNIAVIGDDSRAGTNGQYGNPPDYAAGHSDTLMIVHIAASRKWAEVISIPRDSWVHIPSCDMGGGERSAAEDFKINDAFTLGSTHGDEARGAACTIRAVERNTRLRISHFVVISFAGFKDMVDALDGVDVCTRQPIADAKAKLYLPAGRHVLHGNQALAYVRARYSLGDGSDLGRISRQQAFMSSLASRARSKLYNPISIYRFLDAATKSLTIDSGLGGIGGLYNLASTLKNMPTSKLTFITVPTYPRSLVDPTDTANVMWQQPQTQRIFASLRGDVPWQRHPAGTEAATARMSPKPGTTPRTGRTATPQPSPSTTGRTANQNICTS